jgi:hypothetical protein
MSCDCGDEMTVEAETRESAVQMMKEKMGTEEAIKSHCEGKSDHEGKPMPTVEQCHHMIEEQLKEKE